MTSVAGEHLVFVDESGDHGLATIDPGYPVFVLVFCIIAKVDYARHVLPAVTEFKFKHFGHDQVILHERDIRKDIGDFAFLKDPARKQQFLDELTDLVAGMELTVIASVIRKDLLVGRYAKPGNPYELALEFGLERAEKWLARRGAATAGTPVIVERRGKREDDELELEFRRICAGGNFGGKPLCFEPRFVLKSANVPGLQIADLMARPMGRAILQPKQLNRAYAVLEKKIDRSPGGTVRGWGLKVFP